MVAGLSAPQAPQGCRTAAGAARRKACLAPRHRHALLRTPDRRTDQLSRARGGGARFWPRGRIASAAAVVAAGVLTPEMLAEAEAVDAAPEPTTEEAYAAALADEQAWDLESDGT